MCSSDLFPSHDTDRCYSDKVQIRRPRYKGCIVSDYFMIYSNFEEWCNKQVGFNSLDDFGRDVILLCVTMAGTTVLCSLLFQALIEIYRIESEINQEKRYETIRG